MAALTLRARHKGVREGARKESPWREKEAAKERAGQRKGVEQWAKQREKYATRPTETEAIFALFFGRPKTSVDPTD